MSWLPRALARRRREVCTLTLALGALGALCLAASPPPRDPVGDWRGEIDAVGTTLHLVLHVTRSAGGQLAATLDSLDQHASGLPVSSVAAADSTLTLALSAIGATYEGRMSSDGRTVDGTWSQGGTSLPLIWTRTGGGGAPAAAEEPPPGTPRTAAGIWQGALEAAGVHLRLQLHVAAEADGRLAGSLDSLDQGANGLACANMALRDRAFHFEVPSVGGAYDGAMNAARDAIQGTWTQAGVSLPLSFQRGDHPAALRRPQNPTRPYPYREEEVAFPNARAGITLAGTLTIPPAGGPSPAVLLIAGSGPQARDEIVDGHGVFLVLADSLTRRGIAVLRTDKRGVGRSTGDYERATTADFADDAEAGVAYLRSRREIDPRRVGLLGHSEGGLVAPMVAGRSHAAWIVILAGSAVKGEDILLLQRSLIDQAAGLGASEVARNSDLQRRSIAIVLRQPDAAAARQELTALYDRDPAAQALPPQARQAAARFLTSPWMRYFLTYDPVPALTATRCPVLALYGSKDLQVPPSQNLPPLRQALAAGGNRDVRAEELPGLNHLFQHAATGSPAEYAGIEETMDPAVLDEIASWILQRKPGDLPPH